MADAQTLDTAEPGVAVPPAGPGAGLLAVGMSLVLLALGFLVGLYGGLLVPHGPRPGGTLLSVGVLIALVGNVVLARIGHAALGRFGGLPPLFGWFAVMIAMITRRPEGSLILTGGDLAVSTSLFIGLGALTGTLAVVYPRWRLPRRRVAA